MTDAKKTRPLVTGHSWQSVFALFLVGCVIGTYWEELLYFIMHHEYVLRTGTVIGPFSPIYGYGVAVFAICLGKGNEKRAWWKTYLISCLIGGAAEFIMSLIAQYVFHQVIWDYSDMFLNIMGRTTVPFMLGWGLGGLALMKLVYPLINRLLGKVPYRIGQPIFIALLIFMIINLFLTYGSLGRQAMRVAGDTEATNFLFAFFDKYYPDAWLSARFPAITIFAE